MQGQRDDIFLMHIALECGMPGPQLQRQAFSQVARTDTGGLQTLQQPQGHGEVVQQLFSLRRVCTCQPLRQSFERVFQITIVIE